ncbi:MAG: flagellar biosynthesis anti-sigma factor FlgM [Sulfuritalea sp.]|nr:flagellar biosynthesis anti-sigma factor FlgM [Sulfuritalea sp.]
MKIDSSISSPATRATAQPQKTTNSAVSAPGTAANGATRPVHQAAAPDSATAPFDPQRVAEIRQAIADGRLQIDADKIAARLLDGVRELLAKDRPAA